MVIYKATNTVNGKIYIGQTIRSFEERLAEHKRKNNSLLSKAIRKYGDECFIFEVIDEADDIDNLNKKEKYWIAFYDCKAPKGYNQCDGGDNTIGYHHKNSSKDKMRVAKENKYCGTGNPFYGKKHSIIAKEKMSHARKGRTLTDEWKANIGKGLHKKVINIDTGEVFDSVREAAERYGLKETHITRVCKGKRKTTGGFRWSHYSV